MRVFALFLICMVVLSASAEVKLRIYMQDGTLQAGNLVSETTDAFVILTKDGRMEVPKKRIMFVNGKTLQQWEARPDKLFSTEILPSEIPNPAFVNDRARDQAAGPTIPTLGELKSVTPKPTPAQTPVPKPSPSPIPSPSPSPTPAPSAAVEPANATEGASPSGSEKSRVREKNSSEIPSAVVSAPREEKKGLKKSREKPVVIPEPATEKTETVSQSKTVPKSPSLRKPEIDLSNIVRPKGFPRVSMGDYHYQRGMAFLSIGERGRAIQELHMATLLDRRREEPVYELGRLYKEEGQFDKAEKYFAHPILRKKDEIKKWVQEMEEEKARHRKGELTLNYGTGGGLFLVLVLFGVMRRFLPKFKPAIKQRVITSENAEELKEILQSPILSNNRMKVAAPLAPPVAAVVPAPKPIESQRPTPVPPPAPVEVKKPEPVAPPPPVPTPEPVSIPEFRLDAASVPSVEEVLVAASLVDEAMQRGNAYALDGQPDKARREYRTALALNSAHLDAHLGLAYLSFSQSQWDLALEHYIRALQINPTSADVHYGIGRVMLELDRPEEAVPRFQAALKYDPTFEDARECLTTLGKAV